MSDEPKYSSSLGYTAVVPHDSIVIRREAIEELKRQLAEAKAEHSRFMDGAINTVNKLETEITQLKAERDRKPLISHAPLACVVCDNEVAKYCEEHHPEITKLQRNLDLLNESLDKKKLEEQGVRCARLEGALRKISQHTEPWKCGCCDCTCFESLTNIAKAALAEGEK